MSRNARNASARRSSTSGPGNTRPPTLPQEEVRTSTGSVRIERDPDRPSAVTLVVNGVPSSHLDLDDPGFLAFEYMQQMAAAIDLLDGPVSAVHLGAAGCSLARWVEHERPGSRQIAVDIDLAEIACAEPTVVRQCRGGRLPLRQ